MLKSRVIARLRTIYKSKIKFRSKESEEKDNALEIHKQRRKIS